MDKKEAIEFLEKKVKEIPNLERLPHYAQSVILWRDSIEDVLEVVYGHNSTEFKRFYDTRHKKLRPNQEYTQQLYINQLKKRKTAILSIINKEKITGPKEEPEEKEIETSIENPVQLFDSMHFHRKVIEASRSLFVDGHYAQAILEVFKAVNNFVKKKSGLPQNEMRGIHDSQLMAKIFDVKIPIIKLNKLQTDTDISEQEGFKFLFMGATIGIRNPKAHDLCKMKDPYRTLEYLAFASLLLKKTDFWKVD